MKDRKNMVTLKFDKVEEIYVLFTCAVFWFLFAGFLFLYLVGTLS